MPSPLERVVVNYTGSGAWDPGFESCPYHLLRVQLSASYLNSVPQFSSYVGWDNDGTQLKGLFQGHKELGGMHLE